MSTYIGGETAYYEPADNVCPCSEAGLLECYCGSEVTLQDARDWLAARAIDVETRYADEVMAAVEEQHPDGYEGFHDDVAAQKAARRLGHFDYAEVIRKARAA